MAETFDVIVAGGGHNGLIAACYLAKAGVEVCVVERNDKLGGGVMTRELTVPGFNHDVCSVAHTMIQANPLMINDELQLKSKFGMKYVNPEKMTAAFYDDGTVLEFWTDLERTCQSIAQFSQYDAEAYRRFNHLVFQVLDMIVMGMYNVPPGAGAQAAMMDQSPQGRELMRVQQISAWDLIDEWFEHPKVKIALARYASESMTNPFDHGTGFGFFIILPYMHRYGAGIPVGGSGALVEALTRCLLAHGGSYRVNALDYAVWVGQYKIDPSRVPDGKHMLHIYAFAPYSLKDGGAATWDKIGAEVAQDKWVMKGKMMGSMYAKIYVRPEDLWAALKLMSLSVFLYLPLMLLKGLFRSLRQSPASP